MGARPDGRRPGSRPSQAPRRPGDGGRRHVRHLGRAGATPDGGRREPRPAWPRRRDTGRRATWTAPTPAAWARHRTAGDLNRAHPCPRGRGTGRRATWTAPTW